MDAGFLERLLGGNRSWAGPCTVILDAPAAISTPGPDSLAGSGQKAYAPRVATGRLVADAVLLMREEGVLIVVEQHHQKDSTGQTRVKRTLKVVDAQRVAGLEFDNVAALDRLGIGEPPAVRETEYRPGVLVG